MTLDALTQAALMGTGRQPAPPVDLPGPLPQPAASGPEQQLLRDAAVLRVYRDAGQKPERVSSLPEPAPDEQRPVCPPAATAQLTMILGTYPDLLEEWLRALAAAGVVIPPRHTRALLDTASQDARIALALEPVLSERARWLAAQHGTWTWAAHGDPSDRWQTGTRVERLHVLAVHRARDPRLARELLASTFEQDNARDREAFLLALRDHLTADDEPFLEAALGDRAQGVRAQAAELLSALPGSAFSARMRRRAVDLVDARRRTLNVHLPGELTPDLARDGLNGSPPHGIGRGAWLVSQIIGLAPLEAWETIDPSPAKVIGRRVADGMGDVLRDAWTTAAARQRNPDWAAALLDRGVGVHAARELVGALRAEDAERHAVDALKGTGETVSDWIADAVPAPWSERLTRKTAEWIAGTQFPGRWTDVLALRGDPRLADRLPQPDPASNAGLQLRVVASKLALRRAMLDTLKETTTA